MHEHITMIQELVDHIERYVDEEINVLTLAKEFNLSPWHFQRLFKALVGDSLGSYIRGRRLSKAALMLQESQMSVIEIAFDVGFKSHEAFSRAFKSYFQSSPKVFRAEKPSVLINQKPHLSDELLAHIRSGIENEPIIIEREAVELVGYTTPIPSPFATQENICDMIGPSWAKLFENQAHIEHGIAQTYYGISISPSGTFTEETLLHLAALPVTQKSEYHTQTCYTLPKQHIAMFDTFCNIEADILRKTIDYIYGYWLPNSKYTRAQGDDYELFEEVVDFATGAFKSYYVVPVQLR